MSILEAHRLVERIIRDPLPNPTKPPLIAAIPMTSSLPPLREESNHCDLKTCMSRPPEKQFAWTDWATLPK